MKRYIPLILALCLLLSACAGVQIPDNTTTLPDETTQPSEATTSPEETTLPEVSTDPTQKDLNFDWQNLETFVFSKDRLNSRLRDIIGDPLTSCKEGALYRYHIDSCDLILIAEGPVADYIGGRDGYFYTLETDKRSVMCTDGMGEEHALFYTAQYGDITKIYYNGNLYTLEGNTYIVQTSYPTGESKVFFTQDGITTFFLYGYPEPDQFYYFKGSHEFWVDLETGEITEAEHCCG